MTEKEIPSIQLSHDDWRELVVALHPADRWIRAAGRDNIAVEIRLSSGRVLMIESKGEKGKMDKHIDFEDQKLATVAPGFDSVEDEQSWLQYLDELAATQDAEELERFAAESAYEERKLGKMIGEDF